MKILTSADRKRRVGTASKSFYNRELDRLRWCGRIDLCFRFCFRSLTFAFVSNTIETLGLEEMARNAGVGHPFLP